jgi:hypothetical protein
MWIISGRPPHLRMHTVNGPLHDGQRPDRVGGRRHPRKVLGIPSLNPRLLRIQHKKNHVAALRNLEPEFTEILFSYGRPGQERVLSVAGARRTGATSTCEYSAALDRPVRHIGVRVYTAHPTPRICFCQPPYRQVHSVPGP